MRGIDLPRTLLLFALDDERGTVHPACFIGIDIGLQGAVLADLLVGSHIGLAPGGNLVHRPDRRALPTSSILAYALGMLDDAPSPGPVDAWLKVLAQDLPDLRERLIDLLLADGVLVEVVSSRSMLPDGTAHPMRDGTHERAMLDRVREAMKPKRTVSPRIGMLVGLIDAVHLTEVLFTGEDLERARGVAAWMRTRDPIARAVHQAVARLDGSAES